jgi:hypothetical protein
MAMETLKCWGILTFQEKINRKTEAQAIFLDPSTIWSSCKQNFVVCPLKKKQNEVILAHGLNGLAHLCQAAGMSNQTPDALCQLDARQWGLG